MTKFWRILSTAFFVLIGLCLIAMSLGLIALDGAEVNAPLWIIGIAGGVFLAGSALFALDIAPARTRTVPQWLALLPFLVLLSILFSWVAFGEGPREFTGSSSFLGVSRDGTPSESEGRAGFAAAAVLSYAIIAGVLWQAWQSRKR